MMNNIFQQTIADSPIVKYDIKGSVFDRYLKIHKYGIGEPFKDFDFVQQERKIKLPLAAKKELLQRIEKDIKFQ